MEFEEAEQPTSQTVDVEQPSEPQAPASRFQGLGESIRRAVGIRVPLAASTARPGDRISDTITRFAQAAQERGLSADEAESEARNRFGRLTPENYQELHQRAQQRSSLERERQRVAGAEESLPHRILRNITPFASVFDIPEQNRLTAAQRRLQAGAATPEDTRRIAEHEQLGRARGEQSHLAETLMGAVGMLGETFITGGGSGAGANLLGRMGVWTGAQAAGRSVAGRAASFAGALAVTPSFYLSQAVDRNREQGRDAYDIRGFPPAVTNGAIQMAVFGSLGAIHEGLAASQVDSVVRRTARSLLEGTGVRGVAARVGARAAFGAAEQHAIIEPWTEAISDTLTPLIGHAYRLSTGDGAFRNALKGKWGEAWQQLGVSLITFGAFAAMHEISPAQPPGQNGAMVPASPNAPVPPSGAAGRGYLNLAQQAIQQLHGQGLNREQVLQRITSLVDPKVPVAQAMRGVDPMSPLGQFTIQTRQLGESQRQMNQQAGPPRLEGPKAPAGSAMTRNRADALITRKQFLEQELNNPNRSSREKAQFQAELKDVNQEMAANQSAIEGAHRQKAIDKHENNIQATKDNIANVERKIAAGDSELTPALEQLKQGLQELVARGPDFSKLKQQPAENLNSHLDTVFGNAPRQSRVHPDGTVETGVLIRGEGGTRDRQVLMEFNPQKNTLKIDFQWEGGGKDVFQIGKGASRGSLNFAKQLRDVLTWAKENGVGISSEGKVDIRPDGSIDRSRQQSYDRQLSKMGFEKQADGVWRVPGAERQAASGEAQAMPPAAPQPTRERQLAQLENYVKNSPSPEWVKQNVIAEATGAIRSGLASKIEDLAAQHKTAKQIAKELNIDIETVNAVRNALGIPSMSAPTATSKFGETAPVTQEFQAWRDAHLQRSQATPQTFQTARGSTYTVHPDGTTTRNKATGAGHPEGGPQRRSEKTVYVDAQVSGGLSSAGLEGAPKSRLVLHDGKATLLTWNEKEGRWGSAPSGRNITVHDKPGPGLAPVEMWGRSDVQGREAYKTMHAGSPIVEAAPKSKAEQRLENMRARQQEVKTPEQPKRPQAAPEVKAEIQKTIKEHESWNAAKSVVEDVKAGRDVPHDRLEEANRTLDFTPAEARVFWGTRGPNGVPLAEIGRRMGVSRQRAQQLEASANRKAAEASSAETRAESRAGRAAETPSAREAGMAEGYHEQGAISQERLDLLHDKLTQLLDKAIETGELIDHKTANDIINRFAGEERAAYEQLLRDAGNTPSVRAAAEQVVQSSREGKPNPFESEAGPRVQPGEEAARPAAERGAVPEANQPANAPADAGRGAAGENVVGQPEGAVPQPSLRGLLGEEHGAFVPQQFVENLGKLWTKFKIGWKTRLERLANVEAEALATGRYSVPKEGDKLTEIAKAMENANSPTAKVFEERGIYTLKGGKEFTVGKPFEKLLEPLKHDPADLKPIAGHLLNQVGHWFEKPENATRFDVYTLARSIVDEAQRTPQGIVPAPWLAEARTVLQQFQLDPAFTARANQVHSDLIKYVWNASLLARAAPEVHNLSPAEAIDYIQAHPLYVDARRGMKPEEFLIPNKAYNTMERSGPSDRPFMPPLETARQRLSETAAVINEQIIRNAVEKVLVTPGLEHWSKRITAQEAADPRIPSWRWNDQNGKATYREIKDKALYEVLSGTQGQADPVLQTIKWFSDIELGTGHKILPLISQVQRTAATTLNLAFQVFNNSIRDVYTAISNTRSPGEMVKRIPEMYKRAYMAEWAILTGKIPKDPIFRELKELRGEEMRPTNFGGSPSSSIPTMSTWKDFAKQALRVLGAGELAPRMQELREVYRRQGWSEERISREREAAEQAAVQGKPYVHPIPLSERIAAGNAAREVTVNFGLGGTYVNEINRIVPFFRPAVNGVWKEIHNWRHNTQGAAMALAAYLGARLAHWAMFSDEEWWKDLSGFDKFNNFVVPIGGELRRIPGPRDFAVPAGGLLISALDHATDRNPRWRELWKQSIGALLPNSYLPVPAQIAWDLHGNEDFLGRDIVPERDQRLPASHNLTQHQIPYVLRQLSGGRLQPNLRGLTGFGGAIRPTARLDDYYQELQSLESERALARRQGRAFSGEGRYQTLHGSDLARSIRQLSQEYRTATDERRKDAIRRQQNQLAGQLLRAR